MTEKTVKAKGRTRNLWHSSKTKMQRAFAIGEAGEKVENEEGRDVEECKRMMKKRVGLVLRGR